MPIDTDFLVELVDGTKELREVKGEHLFRDANTARKLRSGDAFCRARGMVFRVVTKSKVDPGLWSSEAGVGSSVVLSEAPQYTAPSRSGSPEGSKPLQTMVERLRAIFRRG